MEKFFSQSENIFRYKKWKFLNRKSDNNDKLFDNLFEKQEKIIF